MKALILCAGKGERLLPITEKIPKPMIPINSKPLLEYNILLCKKHGVEDILINTSHLPEKIKDYFGDGSRLGVKITYSFEKELLGTAGALNNFKNLIDDTFFVIYGDNLTNLNLSEMLKFHKKEKGLGTLYLYREPRMDSETTPGCVVIDENSQIKNIIERPNKKEEEILAEIAPERKLTNAGIYILEPEVLELIQEGFSDFSKDIFPKILKQNKKLYGFQANCYLKEVGQIFRYEIAKKDLESGKIKFDFI